MYYNEGKVNKNGGVVVYTRDGLCSGMEVVDLAGCKVLRLIITKHNKTFGINALYRSHEVTLDLFLDNMRIYLPHCKERNEYF